MTRPFIEFIHSQDLVWKSGPIASGAQWKPLAQGDGGEVTALVRLPASWQGSITDAKLTTEAFVLDGELQANGMRLGLHHYGYWPAGVYEARTGPAGAVLVLFRDAPPGGETDEPLHMDSVALPWDRAGLSDEIEHLHYARKNLRFAPDGGRRTYLLGGMPHGFPANGAQLEQHPHGEEMFLISGDMPCSRGTMTAGAYFYRPPDIDHGLDCTLSGFLMLMRTPGSNTTISRWTDQLFPVRFEPEHCPEIPPNHPAHDAPARALVGQY